MGGVTGQLYSQFAITIAVAVVFSVINALTLSPALAALLLKPATGKKSFLTPFYNGFNRVFGWSTDRYVSFAGILARDGPGSPSSAPVLRHLVLISRIPTGFVPEEDQGYILVNALLPDAASLERTDAVMRKAEAILEKNEAVEGFNTITGYSLLTGAYSSNMGFFFVQLKPWEERTTEETHANGVLAALNRAFAQSIPEAGVVAFGPPAIPGLGTGAGFTMELQDRSGGAPENLAQQAARFMEAARKRPEIGRINSLYRASGTADLCRHRSQQGAQGRCPAQRREHDARRVARQLVHQRLQPLWPCLQGLYAGRARELHQDPKQLGLFYVKNAKGGMVPLDTLLTTRAEQRTRVHQPLQSVPDRRAHGCACRRVLVGAGARCPRGDGARSAAAGCDLRLGRPVVPGTAGPWRGHRVRAGDLPRVPHPGGAVRELGSAVQRSASELPSPPSARISASTLRGSSSARAM